MPFRIRRFAVVPAVVVAVVMFVPAAAGATPANPAGTVVTGRVVDTAGNPLSGVKVLWEQQSQDFVAQRFATTTTADGRFRAVLAVGQDPSTVYFDGTNATGPTSQAGYLRAYLTGASGTRVLVTPQAGRRIAGGTTALEPAAGVSGRVTSDDGAPLAQVNVYPLVPFAVPEGAIDYFPSPVTDAQGRWSLRGLDVAGHTSRHQAFYFDTRQATGGTSPTGYAFACLGRVALPCDPSVGGGAPQYVTLTPGRMTGGTDVTLPAAAQVSGRITDLGGHGIGSAEVFVFGPGLRGYHNQAPTVAGGTTDADGHWTARYLFPGPYNVCYSAGAFLPVYGQVSAGHQAPFGWRATCAHDSPITAGYYAGTSYPTAAGQTTTVPTEALTADGAVTVRVVDTAGHTVPGATIRAGVIGAGGSFVELRSDRFKIGRGTLVSVPPGRVLLCAAAPGYTSTCPPVAGGPGVTVRPSETATAPDLVLAPVGG